MLTQSASAYLNVFFPALVVTGIVTALFYCFQQKRTPSVAHLDETDVLDALPDALFILSEAGTILSSNAAVLDMLGYQRRELQGTPSSLLFPSPSVQEIISRTQSDDHSESSQEMSTDVLTAHGKLKRVSIAISRLGGHPPRRVLRATELHQSAHTDILDTHELDSIAALASGIGHELRSAFSSVARICSIAEKSAENPTEIREFLNQITKTAKFGSKLACRLPAFGKNLKPEQTLCDLKPIIRTIAGKMAYGTDIAYEYKFEDGLFPVLVDRKMIEQVLTNIILNSTQAMPHGGLLSIRATIVNRAAGERQPRRMVRISITDTGIGIDPENIRKIFDSFFTTKPGANGLGLASSLAIIKRHGGDITVLSTPGKGATFHIFLPTTHNRDFPSAYEQSKKSEEAPGRYQCLLAQVSQPTHGSLRKLLCEIAVPHQSGRGDTVKSCNSSHPQRRDR